MHKEVAWDTWNLQHPIQSLFQCAQKSDWIHNYEPPCQKKNRISAKDQNWALTSAVWTQLQCNIKARKQPLDCCIFDSSFMFLLGEIKSSILMLPITFSSGGIFKKLPWLHQMYKWVHWFSVVHDVKWTWAIFKQADKWGQMGADIPLRLSDAEWYVEGQKHDMITEMARCNTATCSWNPASCLSDRHNSQNRMLRGNFPVILIVTS